MVLYCLVLYCLALVCFGILLFLFFILLSCAFLSYHLLFFLVLVQSCFFVCGIDLNFFAMPCHVFSHLIVSCRACLVLSYLVLPYFVTLFCCVLSLF